MSGRIIFWGKTRNLKGKTRKTSVQEGEDDLEGRKIEDKTLGKEKLNPKGRKQKY